MLTNIKHELIETGKKLVEKGLVTGTWGNISVLLPQAGQVLITPSGSNYAAMTPDEVMLIDLEGNVIEGARTPSSEWLMHCEVYKKRNDVCAIVHTHSVCASACAVAHIAIPPITEDLVMMVGGGVDVADYALAGSVQLALNTACTLNDKRAVLLANHGMIGCGKTLAEALTVCELVEKTAKVFIAAKTLGAVNILCNQDVTELKEKYDLAYGCYQR